MSLPIGAGALPIKRNKTVLVNDLQALQPEKCQHLQFTTQNDEFQNADFLYPSTAAHDQQSGENVLPVLSGIILPCALG